MDRDALTAELADVIGKALGDDCGIYDLTRNEEIVLGAHVLSHLHPVIRTVEEFDALPDRTIIMDCDGEAWQKGVGIDGEWMLVGSEEWRSPTGYLPATLLHRGQP